ncbi:MFS transporter [Niallia circulans]|uniref:MFS transporter n=1 Tax=Niallia circulans TaxID=1397 RepID=UPI00155F5F8E|nr:MFS transporter [Niallia circulans]NRG31499.1 MFS transporter [Niallia circulans]
MSTQRTNLLEKRILLWRNALFILFLLPGLSFSSWISRTPEVRDLLSASTATMGWIIFGLAFGSIIGLLSANKVILQTGARYTAVCSIILIAVGLAIVGVSVFATLSSGVFWGLVIFGVGYGLAEVAINVEGAALEHAAKKTLLPALHASFSAGTLIGAGLGALAITLNLSVMTHLLFICLMVLVILISTYRFLPTDTGKSVNEGTEETVTKTTIVNVWKEPRTLLICLIVLGMAFAEGSANDWLPLAMVDGFMVEPAIGTAIYTVFLTAMFVGRIGGGFFLDKYGRVPVLRVASGVATIGLALVIYTSNLPIAIIGVFFWGLGASLGFPVGLSAAGDDPNGAVSRVGIVSVAGYTAFLVGPPILGMIGEKTGLLNAMIIVLFIIIIAGLVSHAAKKPNEYETNSKV